MWDVVGALVGSAAANLSRFLTAVWTTLGGVSAMLVCGLAIARGRRPSELEQLAAQEGDWFWSLETRPLEALHHLPFGLGGQIGGAVQGVELWVERYAPDVASYSMILMVVGLAGVLLNSSQSDLWKSASTVHIGAVFWTQSTESLAKIDSFLEILWFGGVVAVLLCALAALPR